MIDVADKENLPRLKLPRLYEYVDKNQTSMIDTLKEAVAIPSLSREEHFPDVTKMLKLCQSKMNDLGAKTELIYGKNSTRGTESSSYPPILFGNLFIDEELKTICVYAHVDTVSTKIEEDSSSYGFDLTIKNGRMHGRGVSRSKGPLLCWFNALKIYQATKSEIPVNVKFIVEGSAELHSPTLHEIVEGKKKFFQDVDYMCFTIDKKINDGPCLRYGYRGICHFSLDITCGEKDIDSGKYGGAFDQPLIDATRIVSSLMDKHDKLAIPNVVREAAPLSLLEKEIIDKFQPDIDGIKKKIGVRRLRHKENASRIAVHKTRLPCISVHGFETSTDYSDPKNLATISCRTVAKFSIRLVPDQTARDTRIHVENYIRKMWSQYKSVNNFELRMDMAIDPWKEDPTSLNYVAAASAMKLVYGKDPLYVCDGYSLPAVSIVKAICPRTGSLILPLSDVDDFNQNDESMSIENYLNSVKVVMAYMCYINEF